MSVSVGRKALYIATKKPGGFPGFLGLAAGLFLLGRGRSRLDALLLLVARHGAVHRLLLLLAGYLCRVRRLRLGLGRLRFRGVIQRRQLRRRDAHREPRQQRRYHHPERGSFHSFHPSSIDEARAADTEPPAPGRPCMTSLYQYSWCSFAHCSSTRPSWRML